MPEYRVPFGNRLASSGGHAHWRVRIVAFKATDHDESSRGNDAAPLESLDVDDKIRLQHALNHVKENGGLKDPMSIWNILTQRGQDLLRQVATRLQFELPSEPAPAEWHDIVTRNVRLANGLSAADEDLLLRVARFLISEVPFEGCGGLDLDDEMRVTIAANAALLIYKLPYPRFTKLLRVLVYPDTFVPVKAASRHDALIAEAKPALGQAWIDGMVVLSWADILHDAANHPHGGNVIVHEMAHILDGEDGRFDGTPLFDDSGQGIAWARILKRDFDRQRAAYDAGEDGPLDDYAATNRGEFFAVATEAFFCEPVRLRDALPELYEQMRLFFRQDPVR